MLLTGNMPADEFERTVEQLYAGPPDQFIARRDVAAKEARAAGDKELADRIKTLRRPTVAAALLNQLQRRDDGSGLDELLELGEKLRSAQSKLDVKSMKALSTERNSLISQLVSQIAETADEPLSSTVQEQLSDTLVAAVADAAAGRAVGSGRLVSGLRYSGFGDVDLQDAVAIPLRPQPESPDEPPDGAPDEAQTDAQQATTTEPEEDEAEAERQEAQRHADAQRQLAEAREALDAARKAEQAAQQSAELAERALAAARRTAKSTRARAEQATAARSAAEQAVTAAEAAATGTTRT